MRHNISGRKLNRKTSHRIALLKNLSKSLIIHEQIETTLPKAKDLRPFVEKILTIGKTNNLAARRKVYSYLGSKDLSYEEFHSISTKLSSSWEQLAIHLKLDRDITDSIQSITRDPVECCFRMLSAWYDSGNSSRSILATALTEVGQGRLAQSLQ